MNISSAQMSAEEKDAVSHRGKALRAIAPFVIQALK
jgi:XTP/dITP diphosphohydrolase